MIGQWYGHILSKEQLTPFMCNLVHNMCKVLMNWNFNCISATQLEFTDVTRPFLQQAPPSNCKHTYKRVGSVRLAVLILVKLTVLNYICSHLQFTWSFSQSSKVVTYMVEHLLHELWTSWKSSYVISFEFHVRMYTLCYGIQCMCFIHAY